MSWSRCFVAGVAALLAGWGAAQPARAQCSASTGADQPVTLRVDDGQLRSNPLRAFVNRNITLAQEPVLFLWGGHVLLAGREGERKPITAFTAAPHQAMQVKDGNETLTICG